MLPAGSVVFPADPLTTVRLADVGRSADLWFQRLGDSSDLPPVEPIDRVPRIAVLTGAVNQDVWSLRELGFTANSVSIATINSAATDPLVDYDVVFNTGAWPSAANPTARARLTAFFGGGGGYIGALTNGAAFLTAGAQVTGLTAANRTGSGRSAIVYWNNVGGAGSPIVGSFPSTDTAIMDPPTWFTAVPATFGVDGRFPGLPWSNIVASGFWKEDVQSAPGAAVIAQPQYRRHRAADGVRDEPALPSRSGARVVDGRRRGLLGRPVGSPGIA
jgi:hypothetical protein